MQGIKKHKFGLTHKNRAFLLHKLVRKKTEQTTEKTATNNIMKKGPEVVYDLRSFTSRTKQPSFKGLMQTVMCTKQQTTPWQTNAQGM
jgi:hypothetical protein